MRIFFLCFEFWESKIVFPIIRFLILTDWHHRILVDLPQESIATRFTFQMVELLLQLNPIELILVELGIRIGQ